MLLKKILNILQILQGASKLMRAKQPCILEQYIHTFALIRIMNYWNEKRVIIWLPLSHNTPWVITPPAIPITTNTKITHQLPWNRKEWRFYPLKSLSPSFCSFLDKNSIRILAKDVPYSSLCQPLNLPFIVSPWQ